MNCEYFMMGYLFLEDFRAENVVETVLHCGLFVGALFQLIFIFAVIFTPPKKEEVEVPEEHEHSVPVTTPLKQSDLNASRKRPEKKKKK